MLNKRRFLAHRMRDLGLLRVIERLARRPCLLVLAYHRIGDPASTPDYGPVFSATPEDFRAQIKVIQRAFRLLNPTELVDAASGEMPLTEPCAAITFDDGYRDQYHHALPALVDAGASATFFIPPDLIDHPRPFWWDLVSRIIRQTNRERLELEEPARLSLDLTRTTRDEALAQVVRACLAARRLDEVRLAEHLQERAGVSLDLDALGRSAMMTWEQVEALAEAGMGIGSHGQTHRRLADLDESEQSEELVSSKRSLEARLGRTVDAISYPYGEQGDYDDRTCRLAHETGYRAGFTFGGRPNRPGSGRPFEVARINVGSADSPEMVRARLALDRLFGRSFI
ncbi:polysaccharide deacetylase family protein [Tautonia marina]|uniref:polysaccharide deacetylase family protein n=1 Tax=Tautonia marina TaxID=2653855 RepID=UPI001260B376|nr:polysaccharide deacetylase family protein [Tautonia marina]